MHKTRLRAQYEVAQKKRIAAVRVLREALEDDKRTTKEVMSAQAMGFFTQ
jgi:hypothetical protein